MTRTMTIPGIGVVRMRRSRRATRISITVTASGEVRVTLPCGGTPRQAGAFLREKSAWVAAHREKARLLRKRHEDLEAELKQVRAKDAEDLLRGRLEALAHCHGFSYNRVSVRNQKTRWGSCSAKNNISLNEKLARLPQRLIDYVVLHELVHTRVKKHGRDFWLELGKYVGEVGALRSELRQYRLELL